MNYLLLYWLIVSGVALLIMGLMLHELLFALRAPKEHHNYGLYWFNAFFLACATVAVLWGGYYVDGGRREFESLFVPFPNARYAVEQNALIRNGVWVYETRESASAVLLFYREYVRTQNIDYFEDNEMRMSFSLPSGSLFLTIKEEGGVSRIYFSREGSVSIALQ